MCLLTSNINTYKLRSSRRIQTFPDWIGCSCDCFLYRKALIIMSHRCFCNYKWIKMLTGCSLINKNNHLHHFLWWYRNETSYRKVWMIFPITQVFKRSLIVHVSLQVCVHQSEGVSGNRGPPRELRLHWDERRGHTGGKRTGHDGVRQAVWGETGQRTHHTQYTLAKETNRSRQNNSWVVHLIQIIAALRFVSLITFQVRE